MKKENFEEFKRRIEEELKINENNVLEKSIQISNLYNKCLQIYIKELKILKEKFIEREKKYGKLYHKYKFEFDYKLDTKAEIEAYIKSDDIYIKTALDYSYQEIQVKFLEQTLENIKNLGFRIKNFIDLKKMSQGLL